MGIDILTRPSYLYDLKLPDNRRPVTMKARVLLCLAAVLLTATLATALNPICLQPKDQGPCNASKQRYYFDHMKRKCKKFIYGGCGGNKNNFLNIGECIWKCH